MLMPMLTEADPKVSAEGSIDPLGMYAIADALAVRMIPGVRERQTHPRFLTSIAVSLSLCSEFDEDVVAADGVSEPWQVFEWYFVEGMVRTTKDRKLLHGLPGQDKVRRAKEDKVALSEKRYLKTPTVFGFHGVYRALARDTEVERADRLGEVGYELLTAWEKEQGLTGFSGTTEGPGKAVRRQLFDAIRDGLQTGAVTRKPGWSGWSFFSEHLGIYDAAELGAGECPKCHTKNEASRKFCQGCGGSLRLSCLSCDEQIPVWDNFCSECGGKQSELAASKLEEFARQREQAEEYRREYRFEAAISIARSLTSEEDERLAEHVPWAEEFVTATEAAERERESAVANFEEARTHRDAFDYASAIHAVESIPEAMRTSEVSGYLQQLERDRAESEELIKTISEPVKRRDLKGLLAQVERTVELQGDRTDLQKLAGQLREREEKRRQQRDEACNEAKRLFDTGDGKPDIVACVEWSVYPFYSHAALMMKKRPAYRLELQTSEKDIR